MLSATPNAVTHRISPPFHDVDPYPSLRHSAMEDAFVQANEHRAVSPLAQATGVPVIDLSPLAGTPGAVDALAAEVNAACRDWGFFLAVDHGVPDATVARAADAARAFFALPPERKAAVRRTERAPLGYYDAEHTKNVRDWKEVFDVFPRELPPTPRADEELVFVNKWPDYGDLPGFRAAVEEYAAAMEELAFKLLELIARSLRLRPDRLHGFFGDGQTTYMRMNRYPPCPRPDLALGLGRHKDSGALTIRRRRRARRPDATRRRVGARGPCPWLVRRQRRRCRSGVEQRQLRERGAPGVGELGEKERFSIPYFFNPAMGTLVEPLEEMPSRYAAYSWGDFFKTRRRSNFRKLDVDNI